MLSIFKKALRGAKGKMLRIKTSTLVKLSETEKYFKSPIDFEVFIYDILEVMTTRNIKAKRIEYCENPLEEAKKFTVILEKKRRCHYLWIFDVGKVRKCLVLESSTPQTR